MVTCEGMGLLRGALQGAKNVRGIWSRVGVQGQIIYVYYPPDSKLGDILRSQDTIRIYIDVDRPPPLPSISVSTVHLLSRPILSQPIEQKNIEKVKEDEGAATLLSLGTFTNETAVSSGASRRTRDAVSEPVTKLHRRGSREGERDWAEFNIWYRGLLEEDSKPSTAAVSSWCATNGERVWGPNNLPNKQKMRDHVSGLRPLTGPNSVAAHFKKMRSNKKTLGHK